MKRRARKDGGHYLAASTGSKEKKPLNSSLDEHKLVENGLMLLSTWHNTVERYLKEVNF